MSSYIAMDQQSIERSEIGCRGDGRWRTNNSQPIERATEKKGVATFWFHCHRLAMCMMDKAFRIHRTNSKIFVHHPQSKSGANRPSNWIHLFEIGSATHLSSLECADTTTTWLKECNWKLDWTPEASTVNNTLVGAQQPKCCNTPNGQGATIQGKDPHIPK